MVFWYEIFAAFIHSNQPIKINFLCLAVIQIVYIKLSYMKLFIAIFVLDLILLFPIVLIVRKFDRYEWHHLMFKPNPLVYWETKVQKFSFSSSKYETKADCINVTGIVYLVYPKSLLSCYTSIGFLNKSPYPVEIWYHPKETNQTQLKLFKSTTLMNIQDFDPDADLNVKGNNYHFKSIAILHSKFCKVMYIDTDAYVLQPLADILDKFDTSVVAARDYWYTPPINPVYKILNTSPKTKWDMEAGFLFVDKSAKNVINALNMAYEMNKNHRIFYRYIWGDKDTFRLSFDYYNISIGWLDSPGVVTEKFASTSGHSMVHHFKDKPIIIHTTLLKDFKILPEEPFSYSWSGIIHDVMYKNYFSLGLYAHLIMRNCVMQLPQYLNRKFWKLRVEAANKLEQEGIFVNPLKGDKYL
eukprot:NODE_9_length_64580_cov_1.431941.p15 type:complete len:412 gc:universal NODE_9_length_64580_cov_1.431941:41690-40455(-)